MAKKETKKKLTTVKLQAKLSTDKTEIVDLPLRQAEAILGNPKNKRTWKLQDENYKLENGRIIAK